MSSLNVVERIIKCVKKFPELDEKALGDIHSCLVTICDVMILNDLAGTEDDGLEVGLVQSILDIMTDAYVNNIDRWRKRSDDIEESTLSALGELGIIIRECSNL